MEIISSIELPVHERLQIMKNHIAPPPGQDGGKRLCVVTGTHGDELEGQYVAFRLNRLLRHSPQYLHGTVDIYPALNPLGVSTVTRGVPGFDLDMNRVFPGREDSSAVEHVAAEIMDDLRGADLALDIHASNIYLRELPQVRVSEETAPALVPLARLLNVDFVWIHAAATVLESTLAHSLNAAGVHCLVVEMGVGMRITEDYGRQLCDGILCLMKQQGMWSGPTITPRTPIVSQDEVAFVNASAGGIFLPDTTHNGMVEKGQKLGIIGDPVTGDVKEELLAPAAGLLFTLREYPVVYPGSLIARILTGGLTR